jgi:hypothetical protein
VTAASINLAFRLLDCAPLRDALAGSPGVLAVIASSWFFEEVIRHIPAAARSAYRPVPVTVKETTTTGWICLPDQPHPSGQARLGHLPAGEGTPGGPPTVALSSLARDTAVFTGRTRELDHLVAAVSGTAQSPGVIGIHAVDGMAGIGKTAFAVHAAHRLAARFPDGQIFVSLHAHTAGQRPVDPAEALATLLLTVGVAPQRIPPGLEARSAAWRGYLASKKMLLVLDDAADTEQVRPLLPGSAGCLVTSRRKLTASRTWSPPASGCAWSAPTARTRRPGTGRSAGSSSGSNRSTTFSRAGSTSNATAAAPPRASTPGLPSGCWLWPCASGTTGWSANRSSGR